MDDMLDACGYTYCCEALDHKSWIDHLFTVFNIHCVIILKILKF